MEMQIFENNQFGSIRTMTDENGRILFCGSDVAKALGYRNFRDALARHCKGVVKHDSLTEGGRQAFSFIPEPDVYRLIFRSKLPSAEQFEQWVVEIVLPTLRKCGAYITPEVLSKMEKSPEFTAQLVRLLKQEQAKTDSLQNQMSEMTLKCEYFDKLVDTDTLTNIRQTAKELHIPEKLFTYLLVEMGFAYRAKKHLLMPYAFMVTSGFAELKEYTNGKHGGVYMLFTPVGRLYLARKITRRLAVKDMEVHDE
ncbi:BRO family protein [Hydrogenoanaerobacterium sp.]|uniref:BRO family protein n=1 Tax=Hydrogenoanaerobacterium sp. TaxID=2953763 RepID=UPI00289E3E0E|nr:BRO family protein [Hydrogenoanaerobacterium sp.]